ncbi:glycosyltransferase family 2 protein [Patescibacteria group bacterium]|nr:glycosyltransferase family 2 protein [Patescibacteria group bacterium]
MYLSVIIPVYNEEKRLPKTLEEIQDYLSRQNYPSQGSGQANYEIIVVNNGSKDRTVEVVENLVPEIANLKLLNNEENRGKGFAVKQGMLEARGDYRIFTDADNSTSIDQLAKILPWFENGYDVVIGSRDIKGAILDPPQPWQRRMTGEGFKLYRKIILGLWGIQDTQCGFKGFTKKAAENIFPKCKIEGFSFDPEVLLIAQKLNYKTKEIPVYWKNDPDSKVKLKAMIKMAIDLLKIKWNLITKKYS